MRNALRRQTRRELQWRGWPACRPLCGGRALTSFIRHALRVLGAYRQARPQHVVLVLCAGLVLAYAASVFVALQRSYRQTMQDAVATLDGTARSVEVGTTRSIFEIDTMLLGLESRLASDFSKTPLNDPAVQTLLRQVVDQSLVARDILILDEEGVLQNRARSASGPNIVFSDQPFFSVHRGKALPTLFIGTPDRSRLTGGWSLMVSRPLMGGDAIFGVVVAEVPISLFTNFFSEIVLKSGTRVTLFSEDGVVTAIEPEREDLIGRKLEVAPVLLQAAASNAYGVIETSGKQESDGTARVSSYRRLPARPLLVSASRTRNDIFRQWRHERSSSLIALAIFAATAGTLTWLVGRALRRQQLATAELRSSEERLKQEGDLLQSTLENMGEGLSVFDRHGNLIAWNRRFGELLCLPPDLTGMSLREILMLQARRGDFGSNDPEKEAAERLELFFAEIPAFRERMTQSGRILQIRRRPMPGGGVVSLYSDVTEVKASEQQLIQAWNQAERANRSKSDFLANMSHELRTPLNAIIGFSEVICGEILGPMKEGRYLEYIKDIHSSGLHLLAIINDVLDMSKIEAGKLQLSSEPVAIEDVIAEAVRMVGERAQSRRIELDLHLPAEGIVLRADERALKQILLNVISNAIKFSHEGGRVDIRAGMRESNRVVIEVEDFGIGMDADEQERALQPFGQAKAVTTRAYGGTGLGLPITKGLVEAHGGQLVLKSAVGRGTLVQIVLPAPPKSIAATVENPFTPAISGQLSAAARNAQAIALPAA